MLKKILPWYEKYSKPLLFAFWALFTLASALLASFFDSESHLFTCIFIVSILGWLSIAVYSLLSRIFSKKDITNEEKPLLSAVARNRTLRIMDILFVGLIIALLVILQTCDARPPLYYILITVLLGVLVLSILLSTSAIKHFINLIKALVFATLSSMAVFKQFYLAGPIDIGYFAALNEVIAELGYIPLDLAGKQMAQPLSHCMVAVTKILTFSDIQIATICAVVIPSILLTVCVYAIARHYVGEKYGLLAMLLTNIFAYVIYLRYNANPTEWAWIYYLLVLFTLFLWVRSKGKLWNRFGILLVSFMVLTLFAHLFSSVIVIFIVLSLYVGSVLIPGKIFTRFFPLAVIYTVVPVLTWLFTPVGGLNFILSVINSAFTSDRSGNSLVSGSSGESSSTTSPVQGGSNSLGADSTNGIASATPTTGPTNSAAIDPAVSTGGVGSILNLEKYVGIDPPTILDSLLSETTMVIIQCVCLLLPLMLLAAHSILCKQDGEKKAYLYMILSAMIGGLGFFSIIFVAYTGMTIRIGCYLGVIFALGLAFLFAEFSKRAGSNKKKVLHCTLVVVVVCCIGFLNIAIPMINDDTQLWREDYTITAEWTHADLISADTITDYLPNELSLHTNWFYQYTYDYFSSVKKYTDGRVLKELNGDWYNKLLSFDAKAYSPDTYVIFREKMLHSPTNVITRYGDTELEQYGQIGYINPNYLDVLENNGDKLYTVKTVDLFIII